MSGAPHELGVAGLGRALAARELSSVEITEHLLARFARHEHLGTALAIEAAPALAQARAADQRRAAGDAELVQSRADHSITLGTR